MHPRSTQNTSVRTLRIRAARPPLLPTLTLPTPINLHRPRRQFPQRAPDTGWEEREGQWGGGARDCVVVGLGLDAPRPGGGKGGGGGWVLPA